MTSFVKKLLVAKSAVSPSKLMVYKRLCTRTTVFSSTSCGLHHLQLFYLIFCKTRISNCSSFACCSENFYFCRAYPNLLEYVWTCPLTLIMDRQKKEKTPLSWDFDLFSKTKKSLKISVTDSQTEQLF